MVLNEFRKIDLTWDKATSRIHETIRVASSDEKGRKLVVQVLDDGQVTNTSGVSLNLYWKTRTGDHNGLDAFDVVDATKGIFEIYFTTGMLSNVGKLKTNLQMVDTKGTVTSESFHLEVFTGVDNKAVESQDSFSALTTALAKVSGVSQGIEANMEVRLARGTHKTLDSRLQNTDKRFLQVDETLSTKASVSDLSKTNADIKDFNDRVDSIITTPTSVSEQEIIDARQGSDSLGANLSDIKESVEYTKERIHVDGIKYLEFRKGYYNKDGYQDWVKNRTTAPEQFFIKKGERLVNKNPDEISMAFIEYREGTYPNQFAWEDKKHLVAPRDMLVRVSQKYNDNRDIKDFNMFSNNVYVEVERNHFDKSEVRKAISYLDTGIKPKLDESNVNIREGSYLQVIKETSELSPDNATIYLKVNLDNRESSLDDLICIRQYSSTSNRDEHRTNAFEYAEGQYIVEHNLRTDLANLEIFVDFRHVDGSHTIDWAVGVGGIPNLYLYKEIDSRITGTNTLKTLYVSPNGSDNNTGISEVDALKNFQTAIDLGATTIYAERGKYYHQSIVKTEKDSQFEIVPYGGERYSHSKPDRQLIEIINADELSNLTADGALQKASFGGNSRFEQVFIQKTLTPETSGSRPSYNAGLWQVHEDFTKDTKLKPVLTKSECISEKGTFYWDGASIYIHPLDNTYQSFWVHNDTLDTIDIQNVKNVSLQDVKVRFSYRENFNIINCMNAKLQNCHSLYNMMGNGFVLDDSNISLYKCTAYKARNDGFNIHGYGQSNMFDCVGGYNYDDGVSHHNGTRGMISGGEFHHNGKAGNAPTYGSQVDVYNTISHNNEYGLYMDSDSTKDPLRTVRHSGNVYFGNGVGMLVGKYRLYSFNNKYSDNETPTIIYESGELIEL